MKVSETCQTHGCTEPTDAAIRTQVARRGAGSLMTTIWQDPEDAPGTAMGYCVRHAMHLASNLAKLSNVDGAP